MYARQIKQLTSHFDVTFELTLRQFARDISPTGLQVLQVLFLNRKFLFIHSLKRHYKPFSRCKPNIIPTKRAELSKINEKCLGKKVKFFFSLTEKIRRKFTFFSVNTKNISSHMLQISVISRVRSTREITDICNTFDEIYLVFTSKK